MKLQNQNGQSLIQVMIGVAIMGIVVTGFTSMMTTQQRQIQQLTQKLGALDLQRTIIGVLAEPGVCNYMVTNPAQPAFDPMTVGTATPPNFTFNQIPFKGIAGSSAVVSSTSTSPPFSNIISIVDLACLPSPPCTPTTNQFSANIVVGFDQTKLVTPLAPLRFPITINTTGPANSQAISSCGIAAPPPSASGGLELISTQTAANSPTLQWTGIPGTYNTYYLTCSGLRPSSNMQDLRLQFGDGAGPTWRTSNYAYVATGSGTSDGQGPGQTDGNSSSGIFLNYVTSGEISNNAAYQHTIDIKLYGLGQNGIHKTVNGTSQYYGGGTQLTSATTHSGVYDGGTAAVTAIRLQYTGGNIAAGVCSLYGLAP